MRYLPPFVVCALLAAGARAAEPLHLAPAKGVVLLRNGQVLEGTIARTGDYYEIEKPGTRIRLRASDVEKVASRLEELYEEKRSKLDPTRLQDRLDLAEWCVEQRLVDQAAKELSEAGELEPGHPRIGLIQRRLEVARRGDAETTVVAHAADNGPSTEELDRLVRGLPGHAVETFTSTIQPLLVNNCTNSGCHGPQSAGKLRLLRLPLSGKVNRRLTQRNLYAAWQMIDSDRPAASPILTRPMGPHGNARAAIFSGRQTAQYRQLLFWVYEISRQRRPPDPADDPPEPLSQPSAKNERRKQAKAAPASAAVSASATASVPKRPLPREANSEKAADDEMESEGGGDVETVTFTEEKTPSHGGQTTRDDDYRPVDPFDPEIFNRRYFPPQ